MMLHSKRTLADYSYRDAAAESGVSLNTFWRAEQGHSVAAGTVNRLAGWLGVPSEALTETSYSRPVTLQIEDIIALDEVNGVVQRGAQLFGGAVAATNQLASVRKRWANSA